MDRTDFLVRNMELLLKELRPVVRANERIVEQLREELVSLVQRVDQSVDTLDQEKMEYERRARFVEPLSQDQSWEGRSRGFVLPFCHPF